MKHYKIMEKYITFVLDNFKNYKDNIFEDSVLCNSYLETCKAIKDNNYDIWTYDLSHLSFDMIDLGYTIIIANNGKFLTCYPGMDSEGKKDIRKAHNLWRLLLGGYFDKDLDIE